MVADEHRILVELEEVPPASFGAELQEAVLGVAHVEPEMNELELIVDPNRFRMMHLMAYLDQQGLNIRSVRREETTLEDAFLQLTGKALRD